jgi:1,4-alpha-glucan branching enzyme
VDVLYRPNQGAGPIAMIKTEGETMSEKAQTVPRPSGLGAIPGAKGVFFRVWAPHAEKVYR